jgi:hypothetical protein
MPSKKILLLFFILILVVVSAGYYFIYYKNPNIQTKDHSVCLAEDEVADYSIDKRKSDVSLATIFIKNKQSNKNISSFQIELPIPDHYHPIELHKCGVYAARDFNYDYTKKQALSNYKFELWRYRYNSDGESIVFLSGPISGSGFDSDFRVDVTETYVVLERSFLGNPDYALVIKNLETKKDVFILYAKDIFKQYPDIVGDFGMLEWNKDGRYFWGKISDGADVNAFFRIDIQNLTYEVFPAPVGTMGGDALNSELGYVTYDDGAPWTGDAEFDVMYREQWKKEGKKVHFYLYNLFSKKQTLLEIFDDPTWFTRPKWVSDTELEYYLPSGERKVYKIK